MQGNQGPCGRGATGTDGTHIAARHQRLLLQPGIVGYVLGALAIVPAALFLLGTSTAGCRSAARVSVGALAPDFSAIDAMAWRSVFRIYAGRPCVEVLQGLLVPLLRRRAETARRIAKEFAALASSSWRSAPIVSMSCGLSTEAHLDITLLQIPSSSFIAVPSKEFRNSRPNAARFAISQSPRRS